jgi:hypothetical protein
MGVNAVNNPAVGQIGAHGSLSKSHAINGHHITQHADLNGKVQGAYSYSNAPAVTVEGRSGVRGTQHTIGNNFQNAWGTPATLADAYGKAYETSRAMGFSHSQALSQVNASRGYIEGLSAANTPGLSLGGSRSASEATLDAVGMR